jgi:hypothetical protein
MMIQDAETKHADAHREQSSHTFPLLEKSSLIDRTGAPGEPGDCFKPLFDSTTIGEHATPYRDLSVSCRKDEPDTEEMVRRKCFERGFDAGKQDACSLVREETAPRLNSFAGAFDRWNGIMTRIEENACLQTVKMALAIAEKILGAPARCATGGLESLEAELKARMRQAYQLDLRMNPDDMAALSELLACAGVHWRQWDYITATGDETVQTGGVQATPDAPTLLIGDAILRSLDALLSEVSTK